MKLFIIIPTLNEKENIQHLIEEILKIKEDVKIVVVDNNSSDETALIVQQLANLYHNVTLIRHTDKRGKGLAEITGFTYVLRENPEYIIVMDGDFSHQPQDIPTFLEKIRDYDFVLGSRYISGSKVISRKVYRRILTWLSKWFIKILLNIKVKDPTSGYSCFKKETLESIGLNSLFSKGHFINVELLFKCQQKKFRICEVPITFRDRQKGITKLSPSLFLEGIMGTLRLLYIRIFSLK